MITAVKSAGGGDNQWGDGAFVFKLMGAEAVMGKKFGTDEAVPQIELTWEDDDGDGFAEKFINIPAGFGLNDKSKLIERIASVLGRSATALCDDEEGQLGYDFGPGINSFDDLFNALAGGRKIRTGITYNGESIYGKSATLTLETSEKGYVKVRAAGPIAQQPVKKPKGQTAPPQAATGSAQPAPF
jgi:hypothetical protein